MISFDILDAVVQVESDPRARSRKVAEVKKMRSAIALAAIILAAIFFSAVSVESTKVYAAEDAGGPQAGASERVPVARTPAERGARPPAQAQVQTPGPSPTYGDVVYGRASGQDLLVDVYLAESSEPTPVLIFIHGGGWRGGSKKLRTPFLLERILPGGISLVSVEYRFSDVAIHPAQVEDCTRAVQFVRHKAEEWNIDPGKVALMGGSAGAHLALMVGLRDDAANPDSDDPVERQSSRASCVVSLAGPTDFNLIRTIEHKHPAYRTLLGFEPGTPAEEIPQALLDDVSPITYASAGDPPTLLLHGTADTTVPIEHAVKLEKRLREVGAESRLIKLEGIGHGIGLGKGDAEVGEEVVDFIKRHLFGESEGGSGAKEVTPVRTD
jgi:acetyl esterase/lipase